MQRWQGRHFEVIVPFAFAGISQTVTVRTADLTLLVDCGDGAIRDLLDCGVRPESVDAVLITHGHYDHIGGLWSLLGFNRMMSRRTPFVVIAPRGCEEAEAVLGACQHCYGDTMPYPIEYRSAIDCEIMNIDRVEIRPYCVEHCGSRANGEILPPLAAVGYRLNTQGEAVAVTGDTGMCDGVRKLVRGVDLALIEATFDDSMQVPAPVTERVHLTESLARELGATAKDYLLVHRIRR